MNTFVRGGLLGALCATLASVCFADVQAEPAPQPRELCKQVVPERVFREIVREAAGFILEPFNKPRPKVGPACQIAPQTIRANALLIALAAQNRMLSASTGTDAAKLATLRDAVVKLAILIEKHPFDNPEVLKQVEILKNYPAIDVDPSTSLASVRLRTTFTHDDVDSVFGGCGGNRTQRLEVNMHKLLQQKTPFASEQVEKLELTAYKVALLADLLREMDDFIPVSTKEHEELRKEWVRFASDVHQNAWQLTETVRSGNAADMRVGLVQINNACIACHIKHRQS